MADIGLHIRLPLEELEEAAKRRAYEHAKARGLVGTITDVFDFVRKSNVEWKIASASAESPTTLDEAVVTWED
ncbi:MAG: hypothetical protein PVSMB8_00070 [Vulcanimicrobiaceae bacterium]